MTVENFTAVVVSGNQRSACHFRTFPMSIISHCRTKCIVISTGPNIQPRLVKLSFEAQYIYKTWTAISAMSNSSVTKGSFYDRECVKECPWGKSEANVILAPAYILYSPQFSPWKCSCIHHYILFESRTSFRAQNKQDLRAFLMSFSVSISTRASNIDNLNDIGHNYI